MGASIQAGVLLDKTLGKHPWSVGVTANVPLGGEAPSLSAVAGVGAYLGPSWTVIGRVEHMETLPVRDRGLTGASRTIVGGRLVYGKMMAWRAWADVSSDVGIPGIGRNAMQRVQVGGGVALVR
jgi:hypothetical protein